MSATHETAVTKFLRSEMSFYATIVAAIFAIASMYFGLMGRQDLLTQKLDFFTNNMSSVNTRLDANETKINAHDVKITSMSKDIEALQNKSTAFRSPLNP